MKRPQRLHEIIGQDSIKERIKISIDASLIQNKVMPHILIGAGPGLGKTTLATCIANELNKEILCVNGACLKEVRDLIPYLSNTRGVLFVDEAHKIGKNCQVTLLSAMESFFYNIGGIKIDLKPFTLILATTNIGGLSTPLRDRCTFQYFLLDYTETEIIQIIKANSSLSLCDNTCSILAKASRLNPRRAIALLEFAQHYCISKGLNLNQDSARASLKLSHISEEGFEENDRRYLDLLKKGPLSLSSISSTLNIDRETLTNVVEPFLLSKKMIRITQKGRMLC